MTCDFVGGRRMFLFGMFASVICTIIFGLASRICRHAQRVEHEPAGPINGLERAGESRLAVVSRPAPRQHFSAENPHVELYLFGDALARLGLGALLYLGENAGLARRVLCRRRRLGPDCRGSTRSRSRLAQPTSALDEPEANPENVYGPQGNAPRPADLVDLLWPLASSFSFWLVCIISFGLTMVRETFNTWNPIYLKEAVGLTDSGGHGDDALVPSASAASQRSRPGWLAIRLTRGRRGLWSCSPFLVCSWPPSIGLATARLRGTAYMGYPWQLDERRFIPRCSGRIHFLTGVISLDFGGKNAAGLDCRHGPGRHRRILGRNPSRAMAWGPLPTRTDGPPRSPRWALSRLPRWWRPSCIGICTTSADRIVPRRLRFEKNASRRHNAAMSFASQTTNPLAVRLVIFDWAGTTVDHGCFAPVAPFVEALAHHNVNVTLDEAREPMGIGKRDHLRAILKMPRVAELWRAAQGRPWTEADLDQIYQEQFFPRQLESTRQHCRLIPGLLDSVAWLRERAIKIGTSTGYFAEAAQRSPGAQGAAQGYVPDHNVAPNEVPSGRPARRWMIYLQHGGGLMFTLRQPL